MADGYAYMAKINGEWVDINLIESPAELTAKLEKDEEWAKVVRCKECVCATPFTEMFPNYRSKIDTLICTLNDGAEITENDFCS